jgi:hypothetical protein
MHMVVSLPRTLCRHLLANFFLVLLSALIVLVCLSFSLCMTKLCSNSQTTVTHVFRG